MAIINSNILGIYQECLSPPLVEQGDDQHAGEQGDPHHLSDCDILEQHVIS